MKGDLIAIRFKGATTDGNVFDDTTKTDEPLYYRVGTGSLIAGIEEILPMMRYKEKWAVQIPANLAFGSAGRKASAGKPRIPGGADRYGDGASAFPGFEGTYRLGTVGLSLWRRSYGGSVACLMSTGGAAEPTGVLVTVRHTGAAAREAPPTIIRRAHRRLDNRNRRGQNPSRLLLAGSLERRGRRVDRTKHRSSSRLPYRPHRAASAARSPASRLSSSLRICQP